MKSRNKVCEHGHVCVVWDSKRLRRLEKHILEGKNKIQTVTKKENMYCKIYQRKYRQSLQYGEKKYKGIKRKHSKPGKDMSFYT